MHKRFEDRLTEVLADAYASTPVTEITERINTVFGADKKARNEFVKNVFNPEITKRYGNRTAGPR